MPKLVRRAPGPPMGVKVRMASVCVRRSRLQDEGTVNKLFGRERDTQVKVEVILVLRGCVREPEEKAVSGTVGDHFGFAAIQVVSFADLCTGKLVAALDRQHLRDLFDVRDLGGACALGGVGRKGTAEVVSTSSSRAQRWPE